MSYEPCNDCGASGYAFDFATQEWHPKRDCDRCSGTGWAPYCPCCEIGPLLTGPGTSGRTWVCNECGKHWESQREQP